MRFLSAVTLFCLLISCKEKSDVVIEKLFTFNDSSPGAKQDSAYPGHFYFRHDSVHTMAFMFDLIPTQDQLPKKLTMEYKGRIRTDRVHSFASIRMISFRDNEPIYWSQVTLKEKIVDLNTWNNVEGYFVLPPYTNEALFNRIAIFTEVTQDKRERFDIDSMRIVIKCSER